MPAANKEILKHLNNVLRNKLAMIHQYFLHARIMKHMGHMKLADYEYKESIQQMKYADKLVEKVLLLNGIPDLQELDKVKIGGNVEEILKSDMQIVELSIKFINDAVDACKNKEDHNNVDILTNILENEKEHLSFINNQLNLVDSVGMPKYLQVHA